MQTPAAPQRVEVVPDREALGESGAGHGVVVPEVAGPLETDPRPGRRRPRPGPRGRAGPPGRAPPPRPWTRSRAPLRMGPLPFVLAQELARAPVRPSMEPAPRVRQRSPGRRVGATAREGLEGPVQVHLRRAGRPRRAGHEPGVDAGQGLLPGRVDVGEPDHVGGGQRLAEGRWKSRVRRRDGAGRRPRGGPPGRRRGRRRGPPPPRWGGGRSRPPPGCPGRCPVPGSAGGPRRRPGPLRGSRPTPRPGTGRPPAAPRAFRRLWSPGMRRRRRPGPLPVLADPNRRSPSPEVSGAPRGAPPRREARSACPVHAGGEVRPGVRRPRGRRRRPRRTPGAHAVQVGRKASRTPSRSP
jgi:hypothetical protein